MSKPSLARFPGSAPRGMAHSHVLQLSEQWPGRACVTKGYIAFISHASRIDAMAREVSINDRLVGNPHVPCEWDAFYSLHASGFGAPGQFNLSLRITECSFTISVTSVKKAESTDYPEMVSTLERTVLLASPSLRTLPWIFGALSCLIHSHRCLAWFFLLSVLHVCDFFKSCSIWRNI